MDKNKTTLYCAQGSAIGLALLFSAAIASGADLNENIKTPPPLLKAHQSNTKIIYGNTPKELGQSKVSFIIDMSNLGFFEKLAYSSGQWPLSAILFNGDANKKDRLCPYFNLSSRPYQIDQIKAGKMRFLVSTTATPDEIKTIEEYGCIITETPSTSDINFKTNHKSSTRPSHHI